MATKRRLTPDEWAQVRRRWEGAPEEGFDWLAREIAAAWDVALTRQGVSVRAIRDGWTKGGEPSRPLKATAVVAQQKPQQQQRAAVVAQQADPLADVPSVAPAHQRGRSVETGLAPAEESFCRERALGATQTDAYLVAFPLARAWKREAVHVAASELAAKPQVQVRVQSLMASAAASNDVDVAMVLRQYLTMLKADPRELSEVWVAPCRYCHGTDHGYQSTDGELRKARAKWEERRAQAVSREKPDPGEFDEQGGGGYTVAADPHPECPSCGGAGEPRVVLKDSRRYSESALALFGGAKQTEKGIEVKAADRDQALAQVARHVGFFEADKDPAANVTIDLGQLEGVYQAAMDAARVQQEAMKLRAAKFANTIPMAIGAKQGEPSDGN